MFTVVFNYLGVFCNIIGYLWTIGVRIYHFRYPIRTYTRSR